MWGIGDPAMGKTEDEPCLLLIRGERKMRERGKVR
jgi:hypothetical protein